MKQSGVRILNKTQIYGCQEYLAGRACGGSREDSFAGDKDCSTTETAAVHCQARYSGFTSQATELNATIISETSVGSINQMARVTEIT